MEPKWQMPLNLGDRKVEVLSEGWYVHFRCQEPGLSFPWEQIVRRDGNINAVKVLVIVVPPDTALEGRMTPVEVIHRCGPQHCSVLLIHEKRPYPALIKGAPSGPLCELPGGIVEAEDVTISSAAVREFLEEIKMRGGRLVAQRELLSVPSPADSAAHLEAYALYSVVYQGDTADIGGLDEGITRCEVLSLATAYHILKARHEARAQCVELKSLLALLMLEHEYLDRYGQALFRPV
ncbi:MAG: NUDIX domain-containing protein [bacterium]|nr:NUDIX domain-containing protein [bacterium]MDZ4296384.1 NUDIX domain-containing protein [Patescibacteria group bacterium]